MKQNKTIPAILLSALLLTSCGAKQDLPDPADTQQSGASDSQVQSETEAASQSKSEAETDSGESVAETAELPTVRIGGEYVGYDLNAVDAYTRARKTAFGFTDDFYSMQNFAKRKIFKNGEEMKPAAGIDAGSRAESTLLYSKDKGWLMNAYKMEENSVYGYANFSGFKALGDDSYRGVYEIAKDNKEQFALPDNGTQLFWYTGGPAITTETYRDAMLNAFCSEDSDYQKLFRNATIKRDSGKYASSFRHYIGIEVPFRDMMEDPAFAKSIFTHMDVDPEYFIASDVLVHYEIEFEETDELETTYFILSGAWFTSPEGTEFPMSTKNEDYFEETYCYVKINDYDILFTTTLWLGVSLDRNETYEEWRDKIFTDEQYYSHYSSIGAVPIDAANAAAVTDREFRIFGLTQSLLDDKQNKAD